MAIPVTHNFEAHWKGDTFNGAVFAVTASGSPVNLTGATVRMDIRDIEDTLLTRLSSDALIGGMTILDPPEAGRYQIDVQIIDIAPGAENTYDIEITYASGAVHTYVAGLFPVTQDITHD